MAGFHSEWAQDGINSKGNIIGPPNANMVLYQTFNITDIFLCIGIRKPCLRLNGHSAGAFCCRKATFLWNTRYFNVCC